MTNWTIGKKTSLGFLFAMPGYFNTKSYIEYEGYYFKFHKGITEICAKTNEIEPISCNKYTLF